MSEEYTEIAEIFDKDIENFGNDLEKMIEHLNIVIATHNKQVEEIERLNNIIKEVREYIMSELITEWDIKNCGHVSGSDLPVDAITPILEILDKGENNERI